MLSSKTLIMAFLATVCFSGVASANKEPWLYRPDERAAMLSDGAARERRVREADSSAAMSSEALESHSPDFDVIDGKRHPELFFPLQLFRTFVQMGMRSPRSAYLSAMHMSDDLFRVQRDWDVLFEITNSYRHSLTHEESLLLALSRARSHEKSKLQEELKQTQIDLCPVAADALARARQAFGSERFDRFLYRVIAPSTMSSGGTPPAALLVEREKGCR